MVMEMQARVQTEDFDTSKELRAMRTTHGAGAAVSFVGLARDASDGEKVRYLQLEHYEGMTQQYMQETMSEAGKKWSILAARIVHRVGRIERGEQIVFVGVLAQHRREAFMACEYIVDHMKTEVPLWKAEDIGGQQRWIQSSSSDIERKQRWQEQ
jgi:molybdopterin synthase catalytic subunit